MKCLNLGCGSRFHPDFINIDAVSTSPCVKAHDLLKGIPFSDDSFDVVYHSHLLEHLSREHAREFLRECHRVLKTGGVIRIAVPDLEQIARGYLDTLERAQENPLSGQADYDWMMLELYDQAVRERSGGGMLDYLVQDVLPNEAFIYRRIGFEARRVIQAAREGSGGKGDLTRRSRRFLDRLRSARNTLRAACLRLLLSDKERRALEIARFRLRGEIHLWMYDRYSLARLLIETGFRHPAQRAAQESRIPGWAAYQLDADADGLVYKPDSLFMEAVKA
jgi:SAM-dependent methyltransferase